MLYLLLYPYSLWVLHSLLMLFETSMRYNLLNFAATHALTRTYQAFVIYAFFQLMISYLGGERSLLIMLYGRPPKRHIFPVSLFVKELDPSDPFTFLFLKRGILRTSHNGPCVNLNSLPCG